MTERHRHDVEKAARMFKRGVIGRGELYNQVIELVDSYGVDVEMPKLPEDLLQEFLSWITEDPRYRSDDTRPEAVTFRQKLIRIVAWYEERHIVE